MLTVLCNEEERKKWTRLHYNLPNLERACFSKATTRCSKNGSRWCTSQSLTNWTEQNAKERKLVLSKKLFSQHIPDDKLFNSALSCSGDVDIHNNRNSTKATIHWPEWWSEAVAMCLCGYGMEIWCNEIALWSHELRWKLQARRWWLMMSGLFVCN